MLNLKQGSPSNFKPYDHGVVYYFYVVCGKALITDSKAGTAFNGENIAQTKLFESSTMLPYAVLFNALRL